MTEFMEGGRSVIVDQDGNSFAKTSFSISNGACVETELSPLAPIGERPPTSMAQNLVLRAAMQAAQFNID
jgi:hypothetical protein